MTRARLAAGIWAVKTAGRGTLVRARPPVTVTEALTHGRRTERTCACGAQGFVQRCGAPENPIRGPALLRNKAGGAGCVPADGARAFQLVHLCAP